MVEAGADLILLQQLGRWSSLAMVQRYAHHRPERAVEAIRQMAEARERAIPHETPHRRVGGRLRTP